MLQPVGFNALFVINAVITVDIRTDQQGAEYSVNHVVKWCGFINHFILVKVISSTPW